jgi:hypothetical protein
MARHNCQRHVLQLWLAERERIPAHERCALCLPGAIPCREFSSASPRSPLSLFLPLAQGQVDQRIALLRHVEALRLYAAEHDGTLPAKLFEVPVPLPVDPFTGKPFRYEVTGNTAHLRGAPPAGKETDTTFNIHYEVTVRR